MSESPEQMQARHRKELKELQGRITSKKKNATKKTRKGVNDECADMERRLREQQAEELAALQGPAAAAQDDEAEQPDSEPEFGDDAHKGTLGKIEDKVEEGLDKAAQKLLHISPPASATTAGAATTTSTATGTEAVAGGGAGKKRNRQKERMARRAAEQEEAAARAEEEASHMTDNRAREGEYMSKMFATYDLVEKEIEPDGHCLFSAVADQLAHRGVAVEEDTVAAPGQPPSAAGRVVRRAAVEYMAAHADDFAPFVDEDFGGYLDKMRDTAEWGGQMELMALARRYGVEIRVVQDGRMERIGEEGAGGEKVKATLWLAYYRHGYGLGEHYNSLRSKA